MRGSLRRLFVAVVVAFGAAGLLAPPASAIYVHVDCSECASWPLWLQIGAPLVGVGLALVFLYVPYRLSGLARSPDQRVLIFLGGTAFLVIGFVVLARLAVVTFGSASTLTPAGIVGPPSTPPETALPSEPTAPVPGGPALSGIGAPVVAGDQTVVVEKVEQWAGDGTFPPSPGDVYVTVYLAITPAKESYVDTLDTRVDAGDATSHAALFLGTRDPALPTGTLISGVTVKGWMTFEVPSGLAGHLTLMYPTSFLGPAVAIPLY